MSSSAFEPGILKRECKGSRISRECGTTLRSQMGDNQMSVMSFRAGRDNGVNCLTPSQPQTHRVYDADGISPAIPANSGSGQDQSAILRKSDNNKEGTQYMKAEVRRLTPLECERLMGFPDNYTECMGSESSRYSACGNSWASNCARAVINGIHKTDKKIVGESRAFKYGTISSGVECHTLATKGFGDTAVFYSEISPLPVSLLKTHYPTVPVLGDMTLVDFDSEKACVHNHPYEGYAAPDEKAMGFKPYKSESDIEIPCEYGSVDLVSGGTPCFTAGNMVLTDKGYRPIEDIQIGDIVISHLGRPCRVLNIGRKKAMNVVNVKIGSRPTFTVTDNHPFVLSEMYRDNVRKSLTYGRYLLRASAFRAIGTASENTCAQLFTASEYYKSYIPSLPKVYNAGAEEIMELAGWYVGDGYIRNWKGKKKRATILCLNQEKLAIFKERYGGIINYTPCKGRTAWKVQICCSALSNWLSKEFGELALNKTIPAWLICGNDIYKNAFLRGYLTTDGHVSECGWSYATVSKSLAYGIADLLGEANVYHAKLRPSCIIEGRVRKCHNLYEIHKSFGISNKFHRMDGKTYTKVRSINPADADVVYNLEVEGDHTYICNGFCVHNCQSFSVAGHRAGGAEGSGTRSSLAFQLPRIGKAVGAKWLLWENVYGVFSSNGGTDFAWFLYRLQEAGYSIAWRTLDAQYVRSDLHPRAVPQRRRRIWLVAYRGSDWRVPCEVLFEPMKALGTEPPKRTVGVGYISRIPKEDASIPKKTELQEFDEFVGSANAEVIDLLVEKGVCESVEARRNELVDEERSNEVAAVDDLFGFGGDLFASPEETHQGRGLKQSDIELNFPAESEIRKIGQVHLFQWAKSVCENVLYIGDLFKKHEGEPTVDALEPKMLQNIGNAGFLCDGVVCTMKMPEWNAGITEEELATMPKELAELYDGDVCGLSDVLEEDPDPKYKLSWRACYGILKRAMKRGKMLPIELGYALCERIVDQKEFVKWVAVNGKDTTTKEDQLSERQIAKAAFDEFVSVCAGWDYVRAVDPKSVGADVGSEEDSASLESEDDDADSEDA